MQNTKAAVFSLGFWGGLVGTAIAGADAVCQLVNGLPLELLGVPGSVLGVVATACALVGRLKANKVISGIIKAK